MTNNLLKGNYDHKHSVSMTIANLTEACGNFQILTPMQDTYVETVESVTDRQEATSLKMQQPAQCLLKTGLK